jgi:hypothetical protein
LSQNFKYRRVPKAIVDTKLFFTILVVTAIGMTLTPAILDSAFADKGGNPNDNTGDNPYKSCEQKFTKKCIKQPIYADAPTGGVILL